MIFYYEFYYSFYYKAAENRGKQRITEDNGTFTEYREKAQKRYVSGLLKWLYYIVHEDIVNDVKKKMQSKEEYIELASLFKLFGDGTRVQILHALEQSEMCVCDLAVLLGVTKSAVSHQLKALRLAKLVKYRKEAQIAYYSLADEHVKEIIDKGFEHLRD